MLHTINKGISIHREISDTDWACVLQEKREEQNKLTSGLLTHLLTFRSEPRDLLTRDVRSLLVTTNSRTFDDPIRHHTRGSGILRSGGKRRRVDHKRRGGKNCRCIGGGRRNTLWRRKIGRFNDHRRHWGYAPRRREVGRIDNHRREYSVMILWGSRRRRTDDRRWLRLRWCRSSFAWGL